MKDTNESTAYMILGGPGHVLLPEITKTQSRLSCCTNVVQLGNVIEMKNRDNPQPGRVYDQCGLSPCLTSMMGGHRQPMIVVKNDG